VEASFQVWTDLGEPAHDQFGLTVTSNGRHCVWLDEPDSDHVWDLPIT
jgi:hypothetical protein